MSNPSNNLVKSDAAWKRISELNSRRLSAGGFANRTDAVRRGKRPNNGKHFSR